MNCFACNKKLKLIEQVKNTCKCKKTFCNKHINISQIKSINSHVCDWDYALEQQLKLEKIPKLNRNNGMIKF